MKALVWVANLLGWPVVHLVVARIALARPRELFQEDDWLTRERRFERGGRIYRVIFQSRTWKRLLPDGAPWLGGFAKKRVASRDAAYLTAFIAETRRAEWAHWIMLTCTPVFYLWNPTWACVVMTVYGVGANVPCIVAQRANRLQLLRMAGRVRSCEQVSASQARIR